MNTTPEPIPSPAEVANALAPHPNRKNHRKEDPMQNQPENTENQPEDNHDDNHENQPEDNHENQPEENHENQPEENHESNNNHEAAKWRRRLREAEAERDQYREDALNARRQLWGRDYANSLDHQGEAQTIRAHLDELTGTTEAEVQDSAELLLFKYRHDIPRDRSRENLTKALAGQMYSGASAGGALTGHAPSWGDVGQIMRRGDTGD